jgi:mannose-6-phosphate isomerase-like protein (cupin superfamily)
MRTAHTSGTVVLIALLVAAHAAGQSPATRPPTMPPPALDVTAADVKAFIDALPKDRVSDLPIRVSDVGGYKVGVYGVFRPKTMPGEANVHDTTVTEIYYILEGSGTLVTGGTLINPHSAGASPNTGRQNMRGSGISGGVVRTVGPGDTIVIPGRLPHWFSSLDSDLKYMIYRPDPEGLQRFK